MTGQHLPYSGFPFPVPDPLIPRAAQGPARHDRCGPLAGAGLPKMPALPENARSGPVLAGAGIERGAMQSSQHAGTVVPARRAGTGSVRFGDRDVAGLVLCAEQYGAPYDLLAAALGVTVERLRGIVARWRKAGLAQTGTLMTGPAWCWLSPAGMKATGLGYPAARPSLGRLEHIRAVLAVRLWLETGGAYLDGRAWWRSERRIRAATKGPATGVHLPDAEIHWPDLDGAPYAGQIWAIEAELTPKPLARTAGIMTNLLGRTSDYGPGEVPARTPRYAHVVYFTSRAAGPVVNRAVSVLPAPMAGRIVVRDLPEGAGG